MERYVVFIKDMEKNKEFVSAKMAPQGYHEVVLSEMRAKYPAPKYMIHTTYTENELSDVLDSLNRWCGSIKTDEGSKTTTIHS